MRPIQPIEQVLLPTENEILEIYTILNFNPFLIDEEPNDPVIGDFDHYLYSDINLLQQQIVQQEQHIIPDDEELLI